LSYVTSSFGKVYSEILKALVWAEDLLDCINHCWMRKLYFVLGCRGFFCVCVLFWFVCLLILIGSLGLWLFLLLCGILRLRLGLLRGVDSFPPFSMMFAIVKHFRTSCMYRSTMWTSGSNFWKHLWRIRFAVSTVSGLKCLKDTSTSKFQ